MILLWAAAASFICGVFLSMGIILGTFCGMTIASWFDGDTDNSG